MSKIDIIDGCYECRYADTEKSDEESAPDSELFCFHYSVLHKPKLIENPEEIPTWCPLKDNDDMARYLLQQIIQALPQSRDWLDPVLERAVKKLIKRQSNKSQLIWVDVEERLPNDNERVLTISSIYDDPINRYRLLDGQFVRICKDVTKWISVKELEEGL